MRTSPIPPPLWMLIVGAGMWALNHYYPWALVIPQSWRWLGWGFMALAPVAPIAAFSQFRRAQTTANPHLPETATSLVTSGVYAWTRNPMYLGLTILLLGWTLKLGTLSPLAGPILFVLLMRHVQIAPEERALRARFGKDYEQYCHSVNRWIGRRSKRPAV